MFLQPSHEGKALFPLKPSINCMITSVLQVCLGWVPPSFVSAWESIMKSILSPLLLLSAQGSTCITSWWD